MLSHAGRSTGYDWSLYRVHPPASLSRVFQFVRDCTHLEVTEIESELLVMTKDNVDEAPLLQFVSNHGGGTCVSDSVLQHLEDSFYVAERKIGNEACCNLGGG